ncbi:alpha/beta fold hydrolase [Agrobacterium larrymoorei]|uniref:Alpha/beta fold hydrolase n=1 Tax=Agrobacterium larrymoorei TaxID=160699 RepID=A0AAF0KCI1_9HYPH|nr:alpha/beta fold hydrolase [Agrobacterium larrymoorei]WHA39671.1 alpha/beta fold hydrolase [Agrobacterium larrymoorei]
MTSVDSRLVFYFPGFDPLDAKAHQQRYSRSAAQSGKTFGVDYAVSDVAETEAGSRIDVTSAVGSERTESTIFIHDHNAIISCLRAIPVWKQIALGFRAGAGIIAEGAATQYFRHAWRFGLFFLFPYLFILCGLGLSGLIASLPLMLGISPLLCLLSIPAAYAFFAFCVMRFSQRFHTLHLFADWRFALIVGRDEPMARDWIDDRADKILLALDAPCDEVLFVSHSMGASLALAVAARVLELKPSAFDGRNVSFVTLGGAALQCAFVSSATRLRQSIGTLARHHGVNWFDIQCISDPIHLYKCNTAALTGHANAAQPKLVRIKFKHLLSDERYKKNKLNFLRMHRQYVLGSDRKSGFDFTLLTAGPLPSAKFAELKSDVPPEMFR